MQCVVPHGIVACRGGDFNASGAPPVRLACFGHVSWEVRGETQHQQACTRKTKKHDGVRDADGVGHREGPGSWTTWITLFCVV
jgi:hypothetical protein